MPDNALGRVKFIFPNEHFVFLHDTPSKSLFDRAERGRMIEEIKGNQ